GTATRSRSGERAGGPGHRRRNGRYHCGVVTSQDEPTEFTSRYRLTREHVNGALWVAVRERAGAGIALLTLICATWSALGPVVRVAAVLIPVGTFLVIRGVFIRAWKAADSYGALREFVLTVNHDGLDIEGGFGKVHHEWSAMRRITRDRTVWVFSKR